MRTTVSSSSLASSLGLVLQSYLADLRTWGSRAVTGYMVASALMVTGAGCILIAAGVGVAACFHVIEMHYGIFAAYASVGGFFCVAGLAGLLAGRWLLRRPAPPVPNPRRQADMLKQAIVAPAVVRLVGTPRGGSRLDADPVTQGLAATAAIAFVGWICLSRLGRRPENARD
jgi:hypothetical protein